MKAKSKRQQAIEARLIKIGTYGLDPQRLTRKHLRLVARKRPLGYYSNPLTKGQKPARANKSGHRPGKIELIDLIGGHAIGLTAKDF